MEIGTKARKKYSGKAVKANRELSPRSIAVTSSTRYGRRRRRRRGEEKEEGIKAGSRMDLTRGKDDRRGPAGILLVTPTALPRVSFWPKKRRDTLEMEISSLDER